jgi:hypothetical protein
MSMLKRSGIAIGIGIVTFAALHISSGPSSLLKADWLISPAEARVGRPLTPVSVAGVGRRTARRCANGTYNC